MAEVADGTTEELTTESILETLSKGDKGDESEKDEKDDSTDVIPLKDKDEKEEEDEESDESLDEEDDEEEEEETEEDDDEVKEEDEDEDELKLTNISSLRNKLKAKHPEIFKEFRALDHVLHREKAYSEVFTTVKDARAAATELKEYSKVQEELLSGNVTGVFDRVKRTNPKAFEKIASNIIDSLIEVDKDSYIEPARVVFKSGLNNLYSIAAAALKKDPTNKRAEQIQIAVELVHEGLFGDKEVTPYNRQIKEEDKENPEADKLRRERYQIDTEKFQEAHGKVASRFGNAVDKTLRKIVDPKNTLTPYVKNNLIKDVREELDKQLINDQRFGGIIRKLYERAKESNYSSDSLNKIYEALEGKAGSMLLDILRAKKGAALKGTSKVKSIKSRELSRNEGESATTRSSRDGEEKKSLTRNVRGKEADEPQPGESALEYLNRKLG